VPVPDDPIEQILRQIFAGSGIEGELEEEIVYFFMVPFEQF
jgi:hypothetical protein